MVNTTVQRNITLSHSDMSRLFHTCMRITWWLISLSCTWKWIAFAADSVFWGNRKALHLAAMAVLHMEVIFLLQSPSNEHACVNSPLFPTPFNVHLQQRVQFHQLLWFSFQKLHTLLVGPLHFHPKCACFQERCQCAWKSCSTWRSDNFLDDLLADLIERYIISY